MRLHPPKSNSCTRARAATSVVSSLLMLILAHDVLPQLLLHGERRKQQMRILPRELLKCFNIYFSIASIFQLSQFVHCALCAVGERAALLPVNIRHQLSHLGNLQRSDPLRIVHIECKHCQ